MAFGDSRLRSTFSRCRKIISVEESEAGLDKYGRPYCWHCLHEKQLEDANFDATVEDAKRLRTVNEVAVQSRGERRIGDWLAKKLISISWKELDRVEEVLEEKLSRYIRL